MPVEVKGALELRKALRKYAPDLAKELTKELGAALKPIVRKSRSYLPDNDSMISNWVGFDTRAEGKFPQYDATIARKGVTYKTSPTKRNKRGFKSIVTIFNKTAAGAIYETAGRKSFGSVFVRNIDRKAWGSSKGKGDMRGRVIFRAWEEDQGKAQDGVFKALEKAKDAFEFRSKVK